MKSLHQAHKGSETQAGFTIIEVVLAMGIMMLGMSVVLTLLTFSRASRVPRSCAPRAPPWPTPSWRT